MKLHTLSSATLSSATLSSATLVAMSLAFLPWPLACSVDEEEPTCADVRQEGNADARESVVSCYECNYEQTWSGQEQPTDELKRCYLDGWFYVYMYECFEPCEPAEGEPEGCCRDGLDYYDEQKEAMGL